MEKQLTFYVNHKFIHSNLGQWHKYHLDMEGSTNGESFSGDFEKVLQLVIPRPLDLNLPSHIDICISR